MMNNHTFSAKQIDFIKGHFLYIAVDANEIPLPNILTLLTTTPNENGVLILLKIQEQLFNQNFNFYCECASHLTKKNLKKKLGYKAYQMDGGIWFHKKIRKNNFDKYILITSISVVSLRNLYRNYSFLRVSVL